MLAGRRVVALGTKELELRFTVGQGSGDERGQFRDPRGLAVSGSELYVCDRENDRLQVFSCGASAADCKFSRVIGGEAAKLFRRPRAVAVRADLLFVAEDGDGRGLKSELLTLSRDGTPLQAVAFRGQISGLALSSSGKWLAATDSRENMLRLCTVKAPPRSNQVAAAGGSAKAQICGGGPKQGGQRE